MLKYVSAPLNINDMNKDLESKDVYIFDYTKSYYKGFQFYNYISNIGVIADIHFDESVEYIDKKLLLEKYMNDNHFLHFLSFNSAIFNILCLYKKVKLRIPTSCLTEKEEKLFLEEHIELISKWKAFYDSLFYYILCLATLPLNCNDKKGQIKKRFEGAPINNTMDLSVNIVSLLIDDYYYEYYDSGIDESLINYYPYYFENNLYDENSIIVYITNPSNYYLDIINKSLHNEEFQKFLKLK